MPGHRPILGCDVVAALRSLGPPGADPDALAAWVDDDEAFWSLEELERACPPERVGLTSGAYASLFGPLFGEFE